MSSAWGVLGPLAAFGDDPSLDRPRVPGVDLPLKGSRYRQLGWKLEQFIGRDLAATRKSLYAARSRLVRDESRNVKPQRVLNRPTRIADRDHAYTHRFQGRRRARTGVSEALDDAAGAVQVEADPRRGPLTTTAMPCPPAWLRTLRTSDRQRLSGDDGRHRVADLHAVGVHDPAHHLLVGVEVGAWDIAVGTEENRGISEV